MSRIVVATDLHNTLVFSKAAWTTAFISVAECDPQKVQLRLNNKESRHAIAKSLGVSYEDVYAEYRRSVKLNMKLISIFKGLADCGIPVVVVSSAPERRVMDDLSDVADKLRIDRVYCRENFSKDKHADWDKLISLYSCDYILFFGNDMEEDSIRHERVLSVILSDNEGEK